MDVSPRGIPTNHATQFVPKWVAANQEPTIFSVLSQRSLFQLERISAHESRGPLFAELFDILGMKNFFTEPRRDNIFGRQPGIVERRLIGVEGNARGILDDNGLRNCVCDSPQLALFFSEIFLRLLELFDISARSVPPDDLSKFVAERLDSN